MKSRSVSYTRRFLIYEKQIYVLYKRGFLFMKSRSVSYTMGFIIYEKQICVLYKRVSYL